MNIVTEYHDVMKAKEGLKERSHRYIALTVRASDLLKQILDRQNRIDRKQK